MRFPMSDDNTISSARRAADAAAAFLCDLEALATAAGVPPGLVYQELLRRRNLAAAAAAQPAAPRSAQDGISGGGREEAASALDRAGPVAARLADQAPLISELLRIPVRDPAGLEAAAGKLPYTSPTLPLHCLLLPCQC